MCLFCINKQRIKRNNFFYIDMIYKNNYYRELSKLFQEKKGRFLS